MKNGKNVLFGLIGALMMTALVLAGCEIGEYEFDYTPYSGAFVRHDVLKLEKGGNVTLTRTETPGDTKIWSGTYEKKWNIITVTLTSYTLNGGRRTSLTQANVLKFKYRLEGNSLIQVDWGKKSIDNEAVIELELADDFSAEELEALGF
ncbi:hypothetical protein FACS1894106_3690 [Spirochaetia bacterium]|nr:hypothetical protein FACS1894106_3690 [Spirochaetia bacterium]